MAPRAARWIVLLSAVLALPAAAQAARPSLSLTGHAMLRFEAPKDVVVAESHRATDGAGGRFGFATANGWYHATGLEHGSRKRFSYTLSTNDPAGRTIEVRSLASRPGALRITARVAGGATDDVTAIGVGFSSRARERFLGFGERSNAVDQSGNTVESYVGEGPYQPGEYGIPAATVPPWGFHERTDATYFPMPWFVSTRGYGMLVNNYETSRFHLRSEDAGEWSVDVDGTRLDLSFVTGPRPADVVRRLTARTGRQPKPAAPWVLGPWFQTGHDNVEPDEFSYVEGLRAADAPVSAMETHMRYMPCGSDRGNEEEERARAAAIHDAGLAAITYTREAVCSSYTAAWEPALAAGAFLRHPDGSPYTFRSFVGTGVTDIGMLDFSNPATEPLYRSLLDRPYENGFDGWMEDYGEYVPPDSVAANGMTGARMHNFYPVLYHRAGYEYASSKARPLSTFVRSGWTGVHPYARIVWGGDPTTGWGFDGLRSAVTEALTMGLSGIAIWGSDIGGFFTLSEQQLTPELLARWIEFGAVSGVMRTKAEGVGASKESRPQIWEEPMLAIWRRYAKLRTQLFPYIQAALAQYRRTGMPLMRHPSLVYPGDRRAVRREDEFMFGDSLLVAPVTEPGQTERTLYRPRGHWFDFWRAVSYDESDGGLELGRVRVHHGKGKVTMPAPLEELPMLGRAGALLPLLPPEVDTLASYGTGKPGIQSLADRRSRLHVLAFPRGESRAGFNSGGRLLSREGARRWTLTVRSPSGPTIDLEASMATLERPFRPERVRADDKPLRAWRYDRRTRVLRLRLPAGTDRLVVGG